MSPSVETGTLIWNMLTATATLGLLVLLAVELVRNRRIANAKRAMMKRWAEIEISSPTEPEDEKAATALADPWTPRRSVFGAMAGDSMVIPNPPRPVGAGGRR